MLKGRRNYYKKPVGSVAVLGYFVIVPFYKKPAHLSSLLKISDDAVQAVSWAIEQACKEIQASFVVNEQLFDDGIVEAYPMIDETHVSLYLKLPATISIHSAITQLRIHTSLYLKQTSLATYKETYKSLFKTVYLATCMPADPSPVEGLSAVVYSDYIKTFFIENELEGDPANLHVRRREEFGRVKNFISPTISQYV